MRKGHFVWFNFVFLTLLLGSCAKKTYEVQMTSEQAIARAIEEGQRYLVEEFAEWKEWENCTAEFQSMELELRASSDRKYQQTKYFWHVTFSALEESRTVHFIVDDAIQKVIGGWDSEDTAVQWNEEPEEEYQYTAKDAIIRAILYRDIDEEIRQRKVPYLYQHVSVYLDNFGEKDAEGICDLEKQFARNRNNMPLGQAWRVNFCNHPTKEHAIFDFDMKVVVGSDGTVYGYMVTWP